MDKFFADSIYCNAGQQETLADSFWIFDVPVVLAGQFVLVVDTDKAGLFHILCLYGVFVAVNCSSGQIHPQKRVADNILTADNHRWRRSVAGYDNGRFQLAADRSFDA